ncbi:MAG: hypothetical protein JRG91_16850, partial [Deltaproteobacteria bacterium]|nr:hypothetical protein [Deltaproteobacteria bacterium]
MPAKKKTKTKSKKKAKKAPEGLEAALKKVEKSPRSAAAWDELEKLAAEQQSPDEVAMLYRKVMSKGIAKRALAFHEEWSGDDPDAMSGVLGRILEIDPGAAWAFERLCVELTQAGRWDQLLGVYDRELGGEMEVERRKMLLDDAAHAAKDFADEPERALGYMSKLLELDPSDARLQASLERLYERLGKWNEVIEVWRGRIPTAGKKAADIRVRIASAYLDRMGDHGKALDELRVLVDVSPEHEGALELLEKLLGDDGVPKDARLGALGLLRTIYDGLKRDEDAIRVIEKGLEFVERGDVLRKEVARRLVALGRSEKAMEHYETLLVQRPGDVEARTSLVELAGSSGGSDVLARAQAAAGESSEGALRASLLSGAAEVYRESEVDKAIDLYVQVLETDDAEAGVKLAAARTLDDLFAKADRKKERLDVLQRLAGMEQSSSTRRTVLGEVARLAGEMGETQTALEAWRSRLEMDGTDLEALDALVESTAEGEELVKVLRLRAGARVPPLQRRDDLVRMAAVQEKLGGESIETLLAVVEEFGFDAATVEALDASLASAKRWPELVKMLDDAAGEAHGRAARLMERLGEVYRVELGEPEKALAYFSAAAVEDPESEAALGGLRALLDVQGCAFEAGEALARAYETNDDWKAFVEIVDPLVASAGEPEAKVRILLRAAKVHEERAGDAEV